MKYRDVYLTFKTDEATSEMLKFIAHSMNKTQPELIDQICKDFIELLNETAKENLKEIGYTTDT